jgi:hypothetical protein
MLWTRQIQDCVIDGYKEIGRRPAKSAGERRFTQEFDNAVANQLPKFSRRNPNVPVKTNDFR